MMEFNLISKIELITDDNEKTPGLIQDIIDDKIYVSIASDDKQFKILRVGDRVSGIVYDKDNVISFDALITNRIIGELPIYEISMIENLSKVQRRQDVRVDCNLPILYTSNKFLLRMELDDESTEDIILNNEKYFNKGWISDLSAGGIRFSCEKKYPLDSILLLVFDLDSDIIITKGQIVYKSIKATSEKTLYVYGIKFVDINDDKREKIISYNFIIMRKNRLSKRG